MIYKKLKVCSLLFFLVILFVGILFAQKEGMLSNSCYPFSNTQSKTPFCSNSSVISSSTSCVPMRNNCKPPFNHIFCPGKLTYKNKKCV
jgi:hypothetical protein